MKLDNTDNKGQKEHQEDKEDVKAGVKDDSAFVNTTISAKVDPSNKNFDAKLSEEDSWTSSDSEGPGKKENTKEVHTSIL